MVSDGGVNLHPYIKALLMEVNDAAEVRSTRYFFHFAHHAHITFKPSFLEFKHMHRVNQKMEMYPVDTAGWDGSDAARSAKAESGARALTPGA